jgi:hypothetical protein
VVVQVVDVVIMLVVMMLLRPVNLPDQDHCCSLSSKFCWMVAASVSLLLLFQTTFEWCVLSRNLVIICFNQDRPPGESRPELFLNLTFSYIFGQGGTEFDLQSKSYGKWTICDDINELALNNFSNLTRNGPKT